MKTAHVNVNTGSAVRSGGNVCADIHFNVNGLSFPAQNWSDFAVRISSWWCEAALRLLSGKSEHEELCFMEGPYLAEVSSVGEREWQLRCVERCVNRRVAQCQEIVDALPFVESLLSSADLLLQMCRERNWWDKDAETLQSKAALLRKNLDDSHK